MNWFRFKTVILAFVSLLPASLAEAQEWAEKMFANRNHNFGTVVRGADVEYAFRFKNLYKEDVHVSSVSSSCGCTVPSHKDGLIKTFEEGEISAEFNTRSFVGQRSATITVTFDKPFYAQVQLHIAGNIRSDIALNPGAVRFGSVEQGTEAARKISIDYVGRNNWKLTGIRNPHEYLDASLAESSRGSGRVSYDLIVKLKPNAPAGFLKQQISVLSDSRVVPTVPITVEGKINPAVAVTPDSLYLGKLQPGQKVSKRLVVSGKKPFHITEVVCDDSRIELELPEEAKTRHLIPLTFTADEKLGEVSFVVELATDLGDTYVGKFACLAQIINPQAGRLADKAASDGRH